MNQIKIFTSFGNYFYDYTLIIFNDETCFNLPNVAMSEEFSKYIIPSTYKKKCLVLNQTTRVNLLNHE